MKTFPLLSALNMNYLMPIIYFSLCFG